MRRTVPRSTTPTLNGYRSKPRVGSVGSVAESGLAAERLQQRLHPRPEVRGGPGGDQVIVDHGGLVDPVGPRVDHVVADGPDAGRPAALDDLRRDRPPARVADERARLPFAVERLDEAQHRLRAA